jgi:alpha-tubulin suppressor-like RCC1 family protein
MLTFSTLLVLVGILLFTAAQAFDVEPFWQTCEVEPFWEKSGMKGKNVCRRRYLEYVSAGGEHTCGLTSNGAIECFGLDDNGQSNGYRPKHPTKGTFVQVSAGSVHTCGVTNVGAIECFGDDGFLQSNGKKPKRPKEKGQKFIQVSAGGKHTCGLTSNGAIECFGRDYLGQSNGYQPKFPKEKGQQFIQVSAGAQHTCGVTNVGAIECFGNDGNGQSNKHQPKRATNGKFIQVSAGSRHTCGVTNVGAIECFGDGDGDGQSNGGKPRGGKSNGGKPKRPTKGTFVQVSAGEYHTCGVTNVGAIECFGYDDKGLSNKYQPKRPTKGTFVQVSAGSVHTCGVTNVGTIECFGNDDKGQSNGHNPKFPKTRKTNPHLVFGDFTSVKLVVEVSAGSRHTCGVTSVGAIECFGSDDKGQSNKYQPKRATKGTFVQVSAGDSHTCGVTNVGAIECFGLDNKGQSNGGNPKFPTTGTFIQVSAGSYHTCGVTSVGAIECFGRDNKGQSNGHQPKRPKEKGQKFIQVSAGAMHTCGVTNVGAIECFGVDWNGQSNKYQPKRPTTGTFIQVSAGSSHTCGVTNVGAIECFGSDGNDHRSNKYQPKRPTKGTFVQVSARSYHTCGVTNVGAIECFGSDENDRSNKYQPKRPTKGTFIQVSAGLYHTCGVTSVGAIECFGSDGQGQSNGYQPFFFDECSIGYGNQGRGTRCRLCGYTFASAGGVDGTCTECVGGGIPSADKSRCVFPFIEDAMKRMKEDQNDLSIKNSRLWAKEQVRTKHDDWMATRKERDNKKERDFCKEEEKEGTIVFPAIDVPNEIEKIEDTTCIDTNRDELLKAFCSFTTDLDSLFNIQNIDKKAETFFPNICCKERRDTTLEACKDPSGTIPRENIIPFALSQGGHYSRHNLYAEVSDALKKDGYLHQGMTKVLKAMGTNKKEKGILQRRIDGFFAELSLCGPRVVDEPGTEGEKQLCQLFVPYGHVLKHFYNELAGLYQSNSFLEVNERRLGKAMVSRQGKVGTASQITRQLGQSMQMKKMNMPEQQCKAGPTFGKTELASKKKLYCKGINHVDLMTPTIKNVALYYLKKDVHTKWTDKQMFGVKDSLRYEVKDKSGCPSKLFDADDISIQQVAMNADGTIKDSIPARAGT